MKPVDQNPNPGSPCFLPGYRHLLTYDQNIGLGLAGETRLSYLFNRDRLFILREYRGIISEMETDYLRNNEEDKKVLTGFLLDLLSWPSNFIGEPCYVASSVITGKEFKELLAKAFSIIDGRINEALQTKSELIAICRQYDLEPTPTGGSIHTWYASCPSGRGHSMQVSTLSEQWGCGYCKRKGGTVELEQWITENQ